MATVTERPAETRFLIQGVSWETYERLLAEQGDHGPRMTYDRGTLEFMSPLSEHEWIGRLLGRFIEDLTLELRIPIRSGASTTFKSEYLEKGLEPDECYYIASEPLVRGRDRITDESDPPPDLAIEVDITRSSVNRMSIYAALGVAEVWRHDGKTLRMFVLDDKESASYREVTSSQSLPMLSVNDITGFLNRRNDTDEGTVVAEFRHWVRKISTPDV